MCLLLEAVCAFDGVVGFFRSLASMALLVVASEPFFSCICLVASRRVAASYLACMVYLVLPVHSSSLCESLHMLIVVCLGTLLLHAVIVLAFMLSCLVLDPAELLQLLLMLLCRDVCLPFSSLLAVLRMSLSFSATFVPCRLYAAHLFDS